MEQLGLTILDCRGVAMNLQADWGYILKVAQRRLRNNRTHRHIVSEKGRLEIIGAAGEVAARRLLIASGPYFFYLQLNPNG